MIHGEVLRLSGIGKAMASLSNPWQRSTLNGSLVQSADGERLGNLAGFYEVTDIRISGTVPGSGGYAISEDIRNVDLMKRLYFT